MTLATNFSHETYNRRLDEAWTQLEAAIIAFNYLNDACYDGEEPSYDVPSADAKLLEAKVKELMAKQEEFQGAVKLNIFPVSLPAFPSIRR